MFVMPLVNPPPIESSVEYLSWHKLMVIITTERTAKENTVDSTFEFPSAYTLWSAVEFRIFR